MVFRRDLQSVLALTGQRRLELRDTAVLMGLIAYVDWRSGRSKVSAKFLAEQLGIQLTHCARSLTRLRNERLAVRIYDERTGETFFLLNPYLASVGGAKRRGHLYAQFSEALEREGLKSVA